MPLENHKYEVKRLLENSGWNEDEMRWLLNYLENSDGLELEQIMQKVYSDGLVNSTIDPEVSNKLLKSIHQKVFAREQLTKPRFGVIRIFRLAVAAAIIGVIVLGSFLLFRSGSKKEIAQSPAINRNNDDVSPGSNKAILTLVDGTSIVLDSANNGMLANQGSTKVIKLDGKLTYNSQAIGKPGEVQYNTISTPRGGQYQIELPDGSRVWLNSSSSLRFPIIFKGNERRVEITGEAYFEVASVYKNDRQKMPFIVRINDAEVQVLGTHFNIMAYDDEAALKTTLLEGSVKFVKEGSYSMLKPGEQSQLTKDGKIKVVNDVDVNEVVAWKNGMFVFNYADIGSIMRQLSRWYDVEIGYEGSIPEGHYSGSISKKVNVSGVLKILELGGIKSRVEGKKIIVM